MDRLKKAIRTFLKELEENGFEKYEITVNTTKKCLLPVCPGVAMRPDGKLYFSNETCYTKIVNFCLYDDNGHRLCSFFRIGSVRDLIAVKEQCIKDKERLFKLDMIIRKYGVINQSYKLD